MICLECFTRLDLSEERERICRRCREQQKLYKYIQVPSGTEVQE